MANEKQIVGRLETVPIRQAFKGEARDFTTWLESHIEALSDRVGVALSNPQREVDAGDFAVDLVCEDSDGRPVIIENQLEKTNHDHLGKLLTYLVNRDASTAIWIATEPRPEHQKVVDWLNESTPADIAFYLVKVEAVRVGDSPLAPLFTVVSRPDEKAKEMGEKKKEWAERHYKRLDFWKSLLAKALGKTRLFSAISPSRYHWIGAGAGKSGVTFNFAILNKKAQVELYIDHDRETGKGNKAIFDSLHAEQAAIEKDFGEPLSWERLDDGTRACRIAKYFNDGGLAKPDTWPGLQDEMINAMIRLERALKKRLERVQA